MGSLAKMAWLAALGIWAYQGYQWLRWGYWESLPLNAVLQVQDPALRAIEWPVLVQIVVWVLDLNLGITLMALGLVLWVMRGGVTKRKRSGLTMRRCIRSWTH